MADFLDTPKGIIDRKGASTGQSDDVSLLVGGKLYGGWERVRITRALRAISGGFDLSVTDKWAEIAEPWMIRPGEECELRVGKETLIDGYVDRVSPAFSATGRGITVAGRDKTADLVDSSAVHSIGGWQNISFKRFVENVAKPFGVKVTVDPSAAALAAKNFLNICPSDGESGFEFIEKYAKQAHVLVTTDGAGGILITLAGSDRAKNALIEGSNILQASMDFDLSERFSKYTVRQQANPVNADEVSVTDLALQGEATDPEIKRYRPLVIVAGTDITRELCRQRARWEAKARAGKSQRIRVEVVTWRQADGSLWKLNTTVPFESPWLGIKDDFLISCLVFRKGSEGTITELTLEPKDAYTPDPTVPQDKWRETAQMESRR